MITFFVLDEVDGWCVAEPEGYVVGFFVDVNADVKPVVFCEADFVEPALFFGSVCFIGHPFQNGLDLRFVDIQIITVERVTFILSKYKKTPQ